MYRIASFVQVAGILVLAAGIPRAFNDNDFVIVAVGYVIMRLALVYQYLRAANSDPLRRQALHRMAVGIAVLQPLWVLFAFFVEGPESCPIEWCCFWAFLGSSLTIL